MRPLLIARLALVPLALLECGIVYFFCDLFTALPSHVFGEEDRVPGALPDRRSWCST